MRQYGDAVPVHRRLNELLRHTSSQISGSSARVRGMHRAYMLRFCSAVPQMMAARCSASQVHVDLFGQTIGLPGEPERKPQVESGASVSENVDGMDVVTCRGPTCRAKRTGGGVGGGWECLISCAAETSFP